MRYKKSNFQPSNSLHQCWKRTGVSQKESDRKVKDMDLTQGLDETIVNRVNPPSGMLHA